MRTNEDGYFPGRRVADKGGPHRAADGISRSRLLSLALESSLRKPRNKETLDRLRKVYAGDPSPEERRTKVVVVSQGLGA